MAKNLSHKLGLKYIELDSLYWLPDWSHVDVEVFQDRVRNATNCDRWAADGNYHFSREVLWPRGEVLVWLDYSLWTIFWRLWARTWRRWWHKEVLWGTNRERLWPHLKLWSVQDSLFAWLFSTYRSRQIEYAELIRKPENAHLQVIHLKTPAQAEKWLEGYPK